MQIVIKCVYDDDNGMQAGLWFSYNSSMGMNINEMKMIYTSAQMIFKIHNAFKSIQVNCQKIGHLMVWFLFCSPSIACHKMFHRMTNWLHTMRSFHFITRMKPLEWIELNEFNTHNGMNEVMPFKQTDVLEMVVISSFFFALFFLLKS